MKTVAIILATALLATSLPAPILAQTYSEQDETVQRGTIIGMRTVQVSHGNRANETGAAIVGGIAGAILGSQFGGGSGRTLMTGAGAVGGALLGSKIAQGQATRYARQWTIRLDGGQGTVSVVQNSESLHVGERVRVIQGSGGVRIEP